MWHMSDEVDPPTMPVELHSIADRVEIAPGVMMPRLGVGTSHVVGARDVEREISTALDLGYRLIDTAAAYHNEKFIGTTLEKSGVARAELFVTTKVWASDQGYEPTLRAFEASRARLGLDYLDLYLIHWPESRLTAGTWRAFEELLAGGSVRAIGVSNFMEHDLAQLAETATVSPALNQIEFHPYLQRPALLAACRTRGIAVEAWAPLMRGKIGRIPELLDIARGRGKTAAQITLRWILQKGIITIPKAVHEYRLRENSEIYDFALTAEETAAIDRLDRGQHES